MTPMIDILLVLLIIFMIMQALKRAAIDMQIPPVNRRYRPVRPARRSCSNCWPMAAMPSMASRTASRSWNRPSTVYDARPAKLLFVKPDLTRVYGEVIEAIDIARGSGVQIVGFTPKVRRTELAIEATRRSPTADAPPGRGRSASYAGPCRFGHQNDAATALRGPSADLAICAVHCSCVLLAWPWRRWSQADACPRRRCLPSSAAVAGAVAGRAGRSYSGGAAARQSPPGGPTPGHAGSAASRAAASRPPPRRPRLGRAISSAAARRRRRRRSGGGIRWWRRDRAPARGTGAAVGPGSGGGYRRGCWRAAASGDATGSARQMIIPPLERRRRNCGANRPRSLSRRRRRQGERRHGGAADHRSRLREQVRRDRCATIGSARPATALGKPSSQP